MKARQYALLGEGVVVEEFKYFGKRLRAPFTYHIAKLYLEISGMSMRIYDVINEEFVG